MTATEFARVVRAKRIGRGKWRARCPVHNEKTPSLYISDMGDSMRLKCFGCGAGGKEVMKALGLKGSDLFYRSRTATPQIRTRLRLEDARERLERQLGLVIMLQAVEPQKRTYWAAAERRVRKELGEANCQLEPEAVIRKCMERRFRWRLKRFGWDHIWKKFLEGEGANEALLYERHS